MAKFLDQAGLQIVWDQVKAKFIDNDELAEFLAKYEKIEDLQRDYADRAELTEILADYVTDAELAQALAQIAQDYVKGKLVGSKGKSFIFNEQDGGGAKFEGNDGVVSYVGTHDNIGGEVGAQIYVDKANGEESTIIDITQNGAYYTKGEIKPGAQRDVEANEIATKGDIAAIHQAEYSLTKEADPGDYAAVYHLTKDGVNVGEAINIAKDQMLKSVEVKVCAEKDVPVEGLEVGDKYLDFTFLVEKGEEVHRYIAIKDMVKPYTAGEGIIITSDNAIAVDEEVIATVEYVDANISDTMNYVMQEDAAERAARIAGDNLKVDKELQGANGKAYIFNESDGGGAKFVNNNGVESFIGVNDGSNSIVAQIYADKLVDGKWQGAKLDVANDGIYYTVGNKSAAERMVAGNKLATVADVEAAEPDAMTEAEIKDICK